MPRRRSGQPTRAFASVAEVFTALWSVSEVGKASANISEPRPGRFRVLKRRQHSSARKVYESNGAKFKKIRVASGINLLRGSSSGLYVERNELLDMLLST